MMRENLPRSRIGLPESPLRIAIIPLRGKIENDGGEKIRFCREKSAIGFKDRHDDDIDPDSISTISRFLNARSSQDGQFLPQETPI